MLTILCVVALAATALGSPSAVVVDGQDKEFRRAHEDLSYTVQVLRSKRFIASGALISDQYVICSAHILGRNNHPSLSVRAGTDLNFLFSPFGQTINVQDAIAHPDVSQGVDVAVLRLAKPVTIASAKIIPLVGSGGAAGGSLGVVSGWWGWSLKRSDDEVWVVLPKYCAAQGAPAPAVLLCATGSLRPDALLAVDGQLVGLSSSKGQGSVDKVVSYVNLAEASIQKFIAAATANPEPTTEAPPTEETTESSQKPTTVPTDATEPVTASTQAPTDQTTARPSSTTTPGAKSCQIHVKSGLPTSEPIILRDNGDDGGELAFRDPDSGDAVVLAAGERVRFVCSGKGNAFKLDSSKQVLTAQCVGEAIFLVNGNQVALSQLGCKKAAYHTALRNGQCGDAGQFTRAKIGFQVGDDFATLIETCFDGRTFDTVYSRMTLTPAVASHESGVKRPSFQPGDFYEGLNPNTLYTRNQQQQAIGLLLGDAALGTKYVPSNSDDLFLARGHLSPKADYILGVQQSATFYYINAAPQWQSFNADNWEKLESSVRNWVISSGRTVQVVTGIWGRATLPNKDGVETELFLEAKKKYLSVPKYYWKIVYDPATKEGAAFVGMNNPYHVTTNDDVFCQDQCKRYTWLSWNATNQASGYSFCCDVDEFRKVVTTVPADLDIRGLL